MSINLMDFTNSFHPQLLSQERSRHGFFILSNFFRRSGANDGTTHFTSAGSHIDKIIGHFNHIQIMLDNDYGISFINQLL